MKRELNHRAGWLVSDYICQTPRAITDGMMRQMLGDPLEAFAKEEVEMAFRALFSAFCGLDEENSEEDRLIAEKYFAPGISLLDPTEYLENPYYKEINIPEESFGRWQLTRQRYAPYEAFICDDLLLEEDMREVPRVGFFTEEFTFPSVLQDGREWMSIKPSEIVTSQQAVDAAFGDVVTFGLGLGYFAFMALRKPSVKSVTVVERDRTVIELFEKYILPQFPRKNDVRIVCSDAFEYLARPLRHDYAFVDIWHDISDGCDLYVKARGFEKKHKQTKFAYWLERSIKCALADWLIENSTNVK